MKTKFIGKQQPSLWPLVKRCLRRPKLIAVVVVLVLYCYASFSLLAHFKSQTIIQREESTVQQQPGLPHSPPIKEKFASPDHKSQNLDQKSTIDASNVVEHPVVYSNTKRFFALDAFLIDGDRNRPSFSSVTSDYLLVILGVGEFTYRPFSHQKGEDGQTIMEVPKLKCMLTLQDISEVVEAEAIVHVNGTYFQQKFDSHDMQKFSGEKGVWVSCLVPEEIAKRVTQENPYGDHIGSVSVESVSEKSMGYSLHPFRLEEVPVKNQVAPASNSFNLVHCTAPIHGISSYRFLIEYLLYYKAIGYDHMHLYLYETKFINQASALLARFSDFVTIHDWSHVPAGGVKSVHIANFEHGQRLARNDCFFRIRGLARYVSFGDIDELFTVNSFDIEYAAANTQARLFTEFSTGNSLHYLETNVVGVHRLVEFMDTMYEKNNKNIAFQFTSVTVPPFDVTDYDIPPEFGHSRPAASVSCEGRTFELYLSRFCVAEQHCTSPYNCGRYHRGRQKYILRVAKGTINPNSPLFYHGVSENYEDIADKLSVQVPTALGYVRHFAGHFKQSRIGGLPEANRRLLYTDHNALDAIKTGIEGDKVICEHYFDASNEKEGFLKLNDVHNLNRFKKPDDSPHSSVHSSSGVDWDTPADKGFITFERFPGRLNNQLITYDWTFRISKAYRRRLFITTPTKRELWIGLPRTKSEEEENVAIWDISYLRNQFDFVMEYDAAYAEDAQNKALLDAEISSLPEHCVWQYGRDPKVLTKFLDKVNTDPACRRIHFKTGQGLVHPKRTDTRKFGVGPLYFWSALRPAPYLQRLTDRFIGRVREQNDGKFLIGVHSRNHNSYNEPEEKALRRCARLANKPVDAAVGYVNTYAKCCRRPHAVFNPLTPEYPLLPIADINLLKLFEDLQLDKLCKIDEHYMDFFELNDTNLFKVVLSSDHENKVVDDLMYGKYEAVSFDLAQEILTTRPVEGPTLDTGISDAEVAQLERWRKNIEIVLADMLTVAKTDFFHGGLSSTVSHVICFWRLVFFEQQGKEEKSNFCNLLLLSTGGYECEDISCSSIDASFPAPFHIGY